MYGVLAYFDYETENKIKDIWKNLVDSSISFYSEEVKDRRPHITIADYDDLDEEKFIRDLDKFYSDKSNFDITLGALGSFLNSNTLFITPTISKELLSFHESYHEYFKKYNDNPNSFYLPGKWYPHCTIANRLSEEKLTEAFNYLSSQIDVIKGRVNEIGLIKIDPKDKSIVHNIYCKVFK